MERRSTAPGRSPSRAGPRSRSPRKTGTPSASRFSALRTSQAAAQEDRLFIAQLRISIPPTVWTGAFSRAHPYVRMEVLNLSEITPDVSVSDYWISGSPAQWTNELLRYDEVLKVDSLAEVGGGCLYRVTFQNPPIVYLYRRLSLPLQFPRRVQGGSIFWEVVARRSEFEQVMGYAREIDPNLTVVSIRRRPLRAHLPLLTEVQQELLTEAMAAGYFAVPRGITLTALAQKLHRSKSSVSESIALIEKKLLESAMRPGFSPG